MFGLQSIIQVTTDRITTLPTKEPHMVAKRKSPPDDETLMEARRKRRRKCAYSDSFLSKIIDHVVDLRSRGHPMRPSTIINFILNHDDLPDEKRGQWESVKNFVFSTFKDRLSKALEQRTKQQFAKEKEDHMITIQVEERPHLKTKVFVNFSDRDPSILEDAWAITDPLFLEPSRHPAETGDGMVLSAYAPYNRHYKLSLKANRYPRQYYSQNCSKNEETGSDTIISRCAYATGSGSNTSGIAER